MLAGILFSGLLTFCIFIGIMKIYGVCLGFQKKWYIGAIALFVPFFAEIVGVAKFVFKKDLLK